MRYYEKIYISCVIKRTLMVARKREEEDFEYISQEYLDRCSV